MLIKLMSRQWKSSKGFSLMEMLVAAGILSIIALGFLQIQSSWQKSLLNNRQMASRDSIKALADRYILDLKVIQNSAEKVNYSALSSNIAGNEALDYCINGDPASPTAQCPTGSQCCKAITDQPFHILDPSDPTHTTRFSGTDAVAGGAFATTTLSPVRYDINGLVCTTPSPDCALELVTTYTATCLGGGAKCSGASEIFINYNLRNIPGITPTGGVAFKLAKPSTPVLLATAATTAGTAIFQIRCPFRTSIGSPATPLCVVMGVGPLCVPNACPPGWTDLGVSAEYTAYYPSDAIGNCVRTCNK